MVLVAWVVVGCGPRLRPVEGVRPRRVALGKCSACHPAPESGSVERDKLERVLEVHQRRVRLTDDELIELRQDLAATPE